MNLQLLCSARCADVYYDQTNDWVFVDWRGDLTLETVQHTCLSIARCFLDHSYLRVLNSNALVTGVGWEVAPWLASEFLPALRLTGVEQMAWVVPPALRVRNQVLDTVNLFPHTALSLFHDVETAVAWLQQTAPPPLTTGCAPRGQLWADEQQLRRLVDHFDQRLHSTPALREAP